MIDCSKLPSLDPLDYRLTAAREDLADIRLKGSVEAERYVEGKTARIIAPVADLSCKPGANVPLDAQLLAGEIITILDENEGQLWVKSERSGYVGWINADTASHEAPEPTHRVTTPRTFVYSGPDLKFPRRTCLSMGSLITVTGETEIRGTRYAMLDTGLATGEAVIANHIAPVDQHADDFVSVATMLKNTPYLWGGDSAFGIDCAGLVRLSMFMCGVNVLRDSDMQAATIGTVIEDCENWSDLQRGDLAFWRGHVAICQGRAHGKTRIIHANGNTMSVVSEPIEEAIERIAFLYEMPIGARRPQF